MRLGKRSFRKEQCKGFTLFEMVVVICCIVILYMVAEQRLNELPAAAERASFHAILEQIKMGVKFEMYTKLARGEMESVRRFEGTNPMAIMLETPNNYLGELVEVTDTNIEKRGSWYFETSTGELVYVVGGASIEDVWVSYGETEVNFGQIRLKLQNVYLQDVNGNNRNIDGINDIDNPESSRGNWQALLLEPVRPFRWNQRPEQAVEI